MYIVIRVLDSKLSTLVYTMSSAYSLDWFNSKLSSEIEKTLLYLSDYNKNTSNNTINQASFYKTPKLNTFQKNVVKSDIDPQELFASMTNAIDPNLTGSVSGTSKNTIIKEVTDSNVLHKLISKLKKLLKLPDSVNNSKIISAINARISELNKCNKLVVELKAEQVDLVKQIYDENSNTTCKQKINNLLIYYNKLLELANVNDVLITYDDIDNLQEFMEKVKLQNLKITKNLNDRYQALENGIKDYLLIRDKIPKFIDIFIGILNDTSKKINKEHFDSMQDVFINKIYEELTSYMKTTNTNEQVATSLPTSNVDSPAPSVPIGLYLETFTVDPNQDSIDNASQNAIDNDANTLDFLKPRESVYDSMDLTELGIPPTPQSNIIHNYFDDTIIKETIKEVEIDDENADDNDISTNVPVKKPKTMDDLIPNSYPEVDISAVKPASKNTISVDTKKTKTRSLYTNPSQMRMKKNKIIDKNSKN